MANVCPSCRKNNFKWAKRCDHCRTPLTASAEPTATSTAPGSATTSSASATAASTTAPSADDHLSALRCSVESLDPAERNARVEAVSVRMESILASGQKPEWIFLCQKSNGGTLCLPPVNGRISPLMFTSPALALDYFRAIGDQGQIGGVPLDSITELCRSWRKLGVHSFCLDRCPRCSVALHHSLDALDSADSFLKVWAIERASRFLKGQRLARAVFDAQNQGPSHMKVALETLRDHAAADNAHVYQLLAIVAHSEQDAESRNTALARLAELQLPVKLETDDFATGLAQGIVGLMATFELLRMPGAQPS